LILPILSEELIMHVPGYYEFFCPVKTVAGHQALEKIPRLLAA
jgi:hypothetical protein